jgi:TFIIF-interacting CTD phosphatase-like protein
MQKPLLILDVDETLVFADETPLPRAADFRVGPYHVYGRPFLREFIATVSEWFDLAIWSSASSSYVYGVVEKLFGPKNELRFVWACEKCTRRFHPELQEHFYAKNLSKLRKLGFGLERVLMVDDSPEKLSQHYGNYIGIRPFRGDESDRELKALLPFLDALRTVENVRRVEKRFWRQSRPTGPPAP